VSHPEPGDLGRDGTIRFEGSVGRDRSDQLSQVEVGDEIRSVCVDLGEAAAPPAGNSDGSYPKSPSANRVRP
jgi:hypothetical protein